MAGTEITIDYQIKNQSSLPLFNFCLNIFGLPPGMRLLDREQKNILLPSKTTNLKMKIFFERRGYYRPQKMRCCTFFPFNLFGTQKGKQFPVDFLIYPRFGLIKGLGETTSSIKGYQQISSTIKKGISDEYFSSRTCYFIESLRHIDSRAWARLNTPVIREYHNQQYFSSGLFLQTPPTAEWINEKYSSELFEASVELAASCLYTLYESEQKLEFLSTCQSFYDLKQHPNQCFEKAMDFLARLKPSNKQMKTDEFLKKNISSQISKIIFIFYDSVTIPFGLIEHAVQIGCDCRVLIVKGSDEIKRIAIPDYIPVNIIDVKNIKNNSVLLNDNLCQKL